MSTEYKPGSVMNDPAWRHDRARKAGIRSGMTPDQRVLDRMAEDAAKLTRGQILDLMDALPAVLAELQELAQTKAAS